MNQSFKEVTLPSGAILKIAPATFAESKALYQAMLEEAVHINIGSQGELGNVFKDLFCMGFASKKIEACLEACFKKCIYNDGKGDLKIDKDTFEPVSAREDYLTVCMEVAKENVSPFMKSLYAEYRRVLAMIESRRA